MTRDELLEMAYGWLVQGIGDDAGVGEDLEAWSRVQWSDAATRLEGRPGPVSRWKLAMQEKVNLLGLCAALVARGRAGVDVPVVSAGDCAVAVEVLADRGMLTSLCDPPRL